MAKKEGAKMVDIKFVDTFWTWQHFSCPIGEITEEIFEEGLGFDGSSIRGWKSIEASDMLAMPDPNTAFIDPFTGSGMLMAFESGELAAAVILRHREALTSKGSLASLGGQYAAEYVRKFDSRLRISGLLRHAAFKPRLAGLGIALCSMSEQFRNRLARATRSSTHKSDPINRPSAIGDWR